MACYTVSTIVQLVLEERKRQDKKWGELPRKLSDVFWLTVMVEEVGEIAQAILKQDWGNLEKEIIQVIAVGFAWLEDEPNHNNTEYKVG